VSCSVNARRLHPHSLPPMAPCSFISATICRGGSAASFECAGSDSVAKAVPQRFVLHFPRALDLSASRLVSFSPSCLHSDGLPHSASGSKYYSEAQSSEVCCLLLGSVSFLRTRRAAVDHARGLQYCLKGSCLCESANGRRPTRANAFATGSPARSGSGSRPGAAQKGRRSPGLSLASAPASPGSSRARSPHSTKMPISL
jgi:hypothetical protein